MIDDEALERIFARLELEAELLRDCVEDRKFGGVTFVIVSPPPFAGNMTCLDPLSALFSLIKATS